MAAPLYGKSQQENLVTILAHDNEHGKIVARLLEPQLLDGELRVVAEKLIEYWHDFGKAPGGHTKDLFDKILDDPHNRKAKTYRKILRSMEYWIEEVNTEYVLQTLRRVHRLQRMKDAILKSAEKLNAQQEMALEEVEELLADLLRAREYEFDPGLKLTQIDKVLEYLEGHFSEFRTGIEVLDKNNAVPTRGGTLIFLAPTGYGKSWFLIHVGKHALQQRKKVVHISLEMSGEEVIGRYWQSLFALTKREAEDVEVKELDIDDLTGKLAAVGKSELVKPTFALSDGKVAKKLKAEFNFFKKHRRNIFENIRVKRFPARSLTMNGLRAFLDALEATGFTPDMCILDYIGVTATDVKTHRLNLGRNFEDFHAIMVERNMAGVTASQVSKAGTEARVVKSTHVSEDWSLIQTSDVAVTFSQTEAEQRLGLARLFVPKSRSDKDKFGAVITQAYSIGQFCLQSARLDKTYWTYFDTLPKPDATKDEDEDDDE